MTIAKAIIALSILQGAQGVDAGIDDNARCQLVLKIAAMLPKPKVERDTKIDVVAFDVIGKRLDRYLVSADTCEDAEYSAIVLVANASARHRAIAVFVDGTGRDIKFSAEWCEVGGRFGYGTLSKTPTVRGVVHKEGSALVPQSDPSPASVDGGR